MMLTLALSSQESIQVRHYFSFVTMLIDTETTTWNYIVEVTIHLSSHD